MARIGIGEWVPHTATLDGPLEPPCDPDAFVEIKNQKGQISSGYAYMLRWWRNGYSDYVVTAWRHMEEQVLVSVGQVVDLDAENWKAIKQAATESKWMPPEYFMNDWVSDVCQFLREGPTKCQD